MTDLVMLGWWVVSAAVFLALFFAFKGRAYPSDDDDGLPEREQAIHQAVSALQRLAGIVADPRNAHAALWFDDEITEQLHQYRMLDRVRATLRRWGMRGSWKVRFCFPHGTALVRLTRAGDIVHLEITGDVPTRVSVPDDSTNDAQAELSPSSTELTHALGRGIEASVWRQVRASGEGHRRQASGATVWIRNFVAQPDVGLRVTIEVQGVGRMVRRISCTPEVTDPSASAAGADLSEIFASSGGMIGALIAVIAGVCILAFTEGRVGITYPLLLTAGLLAAVLATLPENLRYLMVNAFDGSISRRAFKMINTSTVVIQGAVMAGVVIVSALAGSYVANRLGLDLFAAPVEQLLRGVWWGVAWLAVSAVGYAALRAARFAEIAPNLSNRSMRMSGHGWLPAISISAQSAIGEETVFRLLALPVLLWATGSEWVAVAMSALLWSILHAGSSHRPRWIRIVELTVVGCVLGAITLRYGLIVALLAHFTFNAITLAAPLIDLRRTRMKSAAVLQDSVPR